MNFAVVYSEVVCYLYILYLLSVNKKSQMFQNINDLVQCEKCQAKILEKAWEIHRIMCDKQSKAARPSSIKVSEIKKEDLIPCEQCGQNICFDVYEFHEQQCPGGQMTACRYCSLKFPTFLMAEHNLVCDQRNSSEDEQPYQRFQYSNEDSWPQQEEQQEEQPHHQHLGMLISTLAVRDEKQKQKGLSKKQIDTLPIVIVLKEEDCSICCTLMKRKDRTIKLGCKHIFHKVCLGPWLEQNPHCPMCRKHALKK